MTTDAARLELQLIAKDEASKVLRGMKEEASGFGKVLADVGKIAGGFIAANVIAGAGQKVANFIGDSVKAASDLQQATGGVNSVFKENAQTVLDWGKNNAANFGLSQRAFAEMAGPLGAMLKNTGMDMGAVSGKTIELTKRAADMAATFGGSATDALTAISAALRGETDPIERYGVSMSAAKVEAEALSMTGKTVASTLTDQEKAAARLSLLFKQTADAEGQAAREADTHAGASARATAKMEDMQAQIGEKLLPITVKLTEVKLALVNLIATKVIPALEELYAKHWPAVREQIDKVVKFIQENWPLISKVFDIWFEHMKTIIEGAIQRWKGIVAVISSTVELVKAIFHGDWRRAWEEMKDIAGGFLDILEGTVKSTFGNLPKIALDLVQEAGRAGLALGKALGNGIIDGLNDMIQSIGGREIIPAVSVMGQTVVPGVSLPSLGRPIPRLERGLDYVPYDNFPALLHRGERVMTAAENRGQGVTVNIYLDSEPIAARLEMRQSRNLRLAEVGV